MPPTTLDPKVLAQEFVSAWANHQVVAQLPTARDPAFDMDAAYAVEAELTRLRRAAGHQTAGRKVGYANRAVWRALKMATLVWAPMYDDTIHIFESNDASFSVDKLVAPKLEPEIVFKLKRPLPAGVSDPGAVLEACEWLALGYEVVDCLYPNWKYQPADFVASYGLHVGMIVGKPRRIEPPMIPPLAAQLPEFNVKLSKDGALAAEGSGRNILKSPALCLAELASAASQQKSAEPLAAGEIITTGSMTDAQPIAPNQTWTAVLEGLELPSLSLRTTS